MDLDRLHLIKGNELNVAYYSSTFTLNTINEITFNMLKLLQDGFSIDQVSVKLDLDINEIQHILHELDKQLCNANILQLTQTEPNEVGRITLHVSNDCNLRCKYCYAEGGSYKQQRGLMSVFTAEQFVRFCIDNFSKIEQIVFFGGEPMLNIEVMELICKTFNDFYNRKGSKFIPKFGIITNGTILNQKVLGFIKNNLSFVTVSIDGTKELNDVNRVFRDGSGSYDKISEFIRAVIENTHVPVLFEATFTQHHLKNGFRSDDIIDYLSAKFGIQGTVVNELQIEDNNIVDYWDNVNYDKLLKTNFAKLPVGFDSVLNALVKKNARKMCAVGKHTFAVSIDGEIYPCHMNNGEKQNSLGNICEKNIFNDALLFQTQSSHLVLKNNVKCIKCWANDICGGCAMKWFYNKQTKQYGEHPNADLCGWVQKHLEKILLMIAYIRKKPELWSAFLKRNQTEVHESNN